MYVCTFKYCMYVYMNVCMHVLYIFKYCMYVCMYVASSTVCTYVCSMYVRQMYATTLFLARNIRSFVCMCVYVCM